MQGVFVREHAKAVAIHDDVVVLHLAAPLKGERTWWRTEEVGDETFTEGIPTFRAWYRRSMRSKRLSIPIYLWSVHMAFKRIESEVWRPDIIHANIYSAGFPSVVIGNRRRIPVLITEHYSKFPRRALRALEVVKPRYAFARARFALPVSQALQKAITDYGVRAKFRVVPNVVDTSVFFPPPKGRKHSGRKHLLFVGRLTAAKGFDNLLRAFSDLAPSFGDWRLDVVGEGPASADYEALARSLRISDKVFFHGY